MEESKIGFLHSIFGLSTTPISTSARLMAVNQPPHVIKLNLAILLTLFLPLAVQIIHLDLDSMRSQLVSSLLIIIFFSYVIFTLFEMVFLQIISIDMRLHKMMASVAYSLTPFMVVLWAVYISNFFFDGSITIVTKLLTTHGTVSPNVVTVLNIGIYYALAFGILIYSSCIRSVTEGHITAAFMIAILSVVPGYVCLILGVSLAETAIPGTLETLTQLDQILDILDRIRQEG